MNTQDIFQHSHASAEHRIWVFSDFHRISAVDWHAVPQANISSLERHRGKQHEKNERGTR